MRTAVTAGIGILWMVVVLSPGCSGLTPETAPGDSAELPRHELLRIASRVGVHEGQYEYVGDKTDPVVEEILAIQGREDLVLVVVRDQWCQGHALLVERRTVEVLLEFSPGQYCSVDYVVTKPHADGTYLMLKYATARGNPAGRDELVIRPDNSFIWIERMEL